MDREQQIAGALREIRPADHQKCRADVEQMLDIIDSETETTASKAIKSKVTIVYNALRKIKATGLVIVPELDKHIEACDLILKRPSNRKADKQRLAAAAAQDLLMTHGGKLTASRRGQWGKLTAILYGDPDANMFQYIRGQKSID